MEGCAIQRDGAHTATHAWTLGPAPSFLLAGPLVGWPPHVPSCLGPPPTHRHLAGDYCRTLDQMLRGFLSFILGMDSHGRLCCYRPGCVSQSVGKMNGRTLLMAAMVAVICFNCGSNSLLRLGGSKDGRFMAPAARQDSWTVRGRTRSYQSTKNANREFQRVNTLCSASARGCSALK